MEKWDFIAKTIMTSGYCPGETGKDSKRALIKMGFVILEENDDCYTVQPPNGWAMEIIPNTTWFAVKNKEGKVKFRQQCYRKGGHVLVLNKKPPIIKLGIDPLKIILLISLLIMLAGVILIQASYLSKGILPLAAGILGICLFLLFELWQS